MRRKYISVFLLSCVLFIVSAFPSLAGSWVQEDGKWIEFDMVPGETETRDRRADYIGRVCIIGVDLDKEALQKVFG